MFRVDDRWCDRIACGQDCEGCEFATFEELWCGASSSSNSPPAAASIDEHRPAPPPGAFAPRILSISIELHFWVHQRMQFSEDVERIRYIGLYLQHHYRTFAFRAHRGIIIPYRGQAAFIHPDLSAAGIDSATCCYMYGWVHEELLASLQ